MKIKWFIPIIIITTTLLFGCSLNQSSLPEILQSLEQDLSKEDELFLENLTKHVQKFDLLNNELAMVLQEMKNDDDLEAAIDTLEIAKQEALYIYNLIELEEQPNHKSLQVLRNQLQDLIDDYIEGMNIQLKGITTGSPKQTDEGFLQIEEAKSELQLFLSYLK